MAEKAELRRNVIATESKDILKKDSVFPKNWFPDHLLQNLLGEACKNASFPGPTPKALNLSLEETRESAF